MVNPDGSWGAKQRRVYRENGKFDAVPTTDWGKPETLEEWREAWAELCNAKFKEKELECRIDHRSYEEQGVDQAPTIHEGVAVRQMEAKGMTTDKGERNRWIRSANALLRTLREKIKALTIWLTELRAESQQPTLAALLTDYYDMRNAGAWSNKAKVSNLKRFAAAAAYLQENSLHTLDDLQNHLDLLRKSLLGVKTNLDAKHSRMKELRDLLRYADQYERFKPIHDQLGALKWKAKREQFKTEHESELRQFYLARRKLADGIHTAEWQCELDALKQELEDEYAKYRPLRDEMKKLLDVKYCVDRALSGEKDEGRETRLSANEIN